MPEYLSPGVYVEGMGIGKTIVGVSTSATGFVGMTQHVTDDTFDNDSLLNNEKLWGRVAATITDFLTRVWRDGALMGKKPAEAFFVKCDRTTMTQGDIDNGRLICIVGVAPVKPAEFVIFRIAQGAGGSAVTE